MRTPVFQRERLRRIASIVRRVIGAPDYDRYLAHVRATHPAERPLTRKEFAQERLESRYNAPGSRCC